MFCASEKTKAQMELFSKLSERFHFGTPSMATWKSTMVLYRDEMCCSCDLTVREGRFVFVDGVFSAQR